MKAQDQYFLYVSILVMEFISNLWTDGFNFVLIWNTHLSFDTKFKPFRTYRALLQGHNSQSKILPARLFGIRVFMVPLEKSCKSLYFYC